MKIVKADLPSDIKDNELILFPLSDLHLEDAHCDVKSFKLWIEKVKSTENGYVILLGDLLNTALKNSKSDVYSSTMSPQKALDYLVELLEPIKDKILCSTGGNHEGRLMKDSSFSLGRMIAKDLDIEENYSDEPIMLYISFGKSKGRDCRKQIVSVFCTHNAGGGGKKIGSKMNTLESLESIIDADIYIGGHVHTPSIFNKSFYRSNLRNKKLMLVDKLFCNTNAWLLYGGYGANSGYCPATIKYPIITVDGYSKSIKGTL